MGTETFFSSGYPILSILYSMLYSPPRIGGPVFAGAQDLVPTVIILAKAAVSRCPEPISESPLPKAASPILACRNPIKTPSFLSFSHQKRRGCVFAAGALEIFRAPCRRSESVRRENCLSAKREFFPGSFREDDHGRKMSSAPAKAQP